MLIRNLLEYLEISSAKSPDKLAFCDETESYTFSNMLGKAKSLGCAISHITNRYNSPVVILSERTAATVVSFFGILFSGNYYVPIDAKMPIPRMRSIMDTLSPAILIYPRHLENIAVELSSYCPMLCAADGFEYEADELILSENRNKVLDIDPAYAIFTSGSTGNPKGIVISHRSVIDFAEWLCEIGDFTEYDIMGNQAPFHFDLSGKDIYMTVKCAATTHIIPQKMFLFPKLLLEYINQKNVTALLWATSAFHLVANSGALSRVQPQNLRIVALGGEALGAKQLNRWRSALPNVKYFNLYGPTEVTIDCTWYPIIRDFSDDEVIPIGKACSNMEVFLLDDDLKPVNIGEPGEICVRGIGLAKGYFGDFEKTEKSFIPDPRNKSYRDMIYRTGDIAIEDQDGNLYFRSRKDGQIKHMGYRIELGEVETAINGIKEIDSSICLYDSENKKIVCVYSGNIDGGVLAKVLRTLLPKYMIPNIYHRCEEMPYNSNGKIDRVKLRDIYLNA